MKLNIKALTYNFLIDPLLSGLRKAVAKEISGSDMVIDIACGTGALATELAHRAGHVTGIDLDESLISFAQSRAEKKGISNVDFRVHDASNLSIYTENEFDIAVTSMAIHQFPEDLAVKILIEMKRIAGKVVIADYNCPMPRSLSGSVAFGIERIARGDHYRNFRNYMSKGGLTWFADRAGLTIRSRTINGNGVFVVAGCE
jgi:2-polyprenyl-3-methyl-5-hydroxy-6-metoxy-1,4-benzoquinol methylase